MLALAGYAVAFLALHEVAILWGRGSVFSFWFPAAGVRFGVLWHFGARATLPLALAELAAHALVGRVGMGSVADLVFVISVLLPPLLYGSVVLVAQRSARSGGTVLSTGSVPMTLASVAAPVIVGAASVMWAILLRLEPIVDTLVEGVRSAAVFALGDLLGVLLLAPPIVWLLERKRPTLRVSGAGTKRLAESVGALAIAWALTGLMLYAGLGLRLVPVMLAVVWIALRAGRAPAWLAVVASAAVIVPLTAQETSDAVRFAAHLALAATAIVGDLVGSFADAETMLHEQLARRNRLLFQADRLKTLRAMSAAVIHEIGQPLSIVAIEARHLSQVANGADQDRAEIAATASLIDRKVADLVDLVRRFRRFGETARGEPRLVRVDEMVREALSIAEVDAAARRIRFDVRTTHDLWIEGDMVELQQALLNLLRNSIQHSADGCVRIVASRLPNDEVFIDVENRAGAERRLATGMGIGLLVTTSIVEAFGGTLARDLGGDQVRFRMTFPGARHD
jgi:signal transduction histidine kinase